MAKILIAEDEPDIRDLITFTLRYAGHEVIATANGEEAYLKAQEVIPDLIMMDVRMPRMTGYEACRKMKEIDALKPIPVVFLSAKGQESEVQAGLEAGAVEYILKPFAPDQLTTRVKVILEKYSQAQAPSQPTPLPQASPPAQPAQQQIPQAAPPAQPQQPQATPPAQPPQQPTPPPVAPQEPEPPQTAPPAQPAQPKATPPAWQPRQPGPSPTPPPATPPQQPRPAAPQPTPPQPEQPKEPPAEEEAEPIWRRVYRQSDQETEPQPDEQTDEQKGEQTSDSEDKKPRWPF